MFDKFLADLRLPQLNNLRSMASEMGHEEIVTTIDEVIATKSDGQPWRAVIVRSAGSGVWYGGLAYHDHRTRTVEGSGDGSG